MFDGQPKELIVYETATGAQPFVEWFQALRDRVGQARIRARLERLEQQGNPGDYNTVGGGVYELRIDTSPGYRVYLGLAGQRLVLLLCGGDKSTQARDVTQAQTNWRLSTEASMTTWKEILTTDLAASAETAAEFLRASLEFDDPQFLALALQRVLAARGSLGDLPLSAQEWASLVEALAQPPLQQAA